MVEVLVFALIGLAGLGLVATLGHGKRALLHLLVLSVYFSGYVGATQPDHFVTLGILLVLFVTQRNSPVWVFVLLGVMVALLAASVWLPDQERQVRLLALYPLAFVVGAKLDEVTRHHLFRIHAGWSVVVALLALREAQAQQWLLARPDYPDGLFRDGSLRTVVGAEHPLTMSVLLAIAVPMVLRLNVAVVWRALFVGVLLAGIATTGSRGGIALALLGLALYLFNRPGRRNALRPWVSKAAIAGGVLAVVWLLAFAADEGGSRSLLSRSSEGASAEYRLRLYQTLGDSLAAQPFGWGWAGLPPHQYVLQSVFGPRDLSITVDSEVALLVFDAGYIGLLAFVVLSWLVLRKSGLSVPDTHPAVLLLLSGTYLALHSWSGLGVAVMLFVGIAAVRRGDGTTAGESEDSPQASETLSAARGAVDRRSASPLTALGTSPTRRRFKSGQ